MARPRGRALRGKRLVSAVPHGHWKTTTFVAGLRQAGVVAPLVLDGPMNGTAFRAYVEQMLAPTLRPGDIVIMDNLSAHKVAGVRQAIEARRAELVYLPPYSPDLNPIEQRSPGSRRCCARPPRAPSAPCGRPSARCSRASNRTSVPTTSATQAMALPERNPL